MSDISIVTEGEINWNRVPQETKQEHLTPRINAHFECDKHLCMISQFFCGCVLLLRLLSCLDWVYCSSLGANVYCRMDQSSFIANVCVVMMVLNNATALPFSFHIIYCAYRPRRVECFQLLWYKVVPRGFFSSSPSSLRAFHGEKQFMPSLFRWAITLISDRCVWCAERWSKINSKRKAVRDLQRSALINKGLYQLGSHDWCVNVSAVTQFGIQSNTTVHWAQRA